MRIIKKPKLGPTIFDCPACGCKYEALYGEYSLYSDILTQTYKRTLKQCRCPICGAMNQVETEFEEDKA